MLEEEKPLTFLRSMMDQAELVTRLRQVSRVSILPRVKALLGLANTSSPDPIRYVITIGFDEHAADTLYNSNSIFSLFIIVVLYRFIESLLLLRGNQSHIGVSIAHGVEQPPNGTYDDVDIVYNEHIIPDQVGASSNDARHADSNDGSDDRSLASH
jgi:hypothetical protein